MFRNHSLGSESSVQTEKIPQNDSGKTKVYPTDTSIGMSFSGLFQCDSNEQSLKLSEPEENSMLSTFDHMEQNSKYKKRPKKGKSKHKKTVEVAKNHFRKQCVLKTLIFVFALIILVKILSLQFFSPNQCSVGQKESEENQVKNPMQFYKIKRLKIKINSGVKQSQHEQQNQQSVQQLPYKNQLLRPEEISDSKIAETKKNQIPIAEKNIQNVQEKIKNLSTEKKTIQNLPLDPKISSETTNSVTQSEQQKILPENATKNSTQKSCVLPAPSKESLKRGTSPECLEYIKQERLKNGMLYRLGVSWDMFYENSNVSSFTYSLLTSIDKEKYTEAINAVDLIHQLDPNWKLDIKDDNPCVKKTQLMERLNQTINYQYKRLNKSYQIEKYNKNQLRFCIVSSSYNNAENGLLYRNIDSILQQNYTNYHVVYTDDASSDKTGEVVKKYLKEKNVEDGKFKVKINGEKKGMMENIFNAVTYDCQLGEIVVMVDGDDSLIGTNVLSLLNALYQKEKVALVWNNFIEVQFNKLAILGFSRQISNYEQNRVYVRNKTLLLSSHLKSFYVDLFRKIDVKDLKYEDGKFFGGASDTAMMIPMLEMSFPKFKYVPEIVYEYRMDTGHNGMIENRIPQAIALSKISGSKGYSQLKDFSFIDLSIQKAMSSKNS